MTTLAYVVVAPEQESLELVNAGHPPPLVVDPAGAASFLAARRAGSRSATSAARPLPVRRAPVPDGRSPRALHGRPGRVAWPVDRRGPGAAARGRRGTRERRATVLRDRERLVPEQRPDDIAVIAARVPPPPERLRGALAGRASSRSSPSASSCGAGCVPSRRATTRSTTSPSPARRRARTRSSTPTAPGDRVVRGRGDLRGPSRPRDGPRPGPLAAARAGSNRGRGLP